MLKSLQKALRPLEGKVPSTEEAWMKIAREFHNAWQYPNLLGAIDGKHVELKKPPSSGSIYWKHKKDFSILLLAIIDANYRFIYTNIGEELIMNIFSF